MSMKNKRLIQESTTTMKEGSCGPLSDDNICILSGNGESVIEYIFAKLR